jgi:hypothetical protein
MQPMTVELGIMAEVLLKADTGVLTLPEGVTTAVADEDYEDDNEGAEGEGQTLVEVEEGKILFLNVF